MQTITLVLVKFHLIILSREFQPVEIFLNLRSVMDFCYVYLLLSTTRIEEVCKEIYAAGLTQSQRNREETAVMIAQEGRRQPAFSNKVAVL